MKKLLCCSVALFSILCSFAQNQKNSNDSARLVGQTIYNVARKGDKINGSPYLNQMFTLAKVENIANNTYMRYNIFSDEFEFITPKNDTLVLDKIEDFGTITLIGLNKKYQLKQYTNGGKLAYGYLVNRYEKGGYTLFAKENISFHEGKKAKTSMERDMPSRYDKNDDTYFLQNKTGVVTEFPDGKKALVKLFPEKKSQIETFVKENKISFDEKADLIKVIDFLTTL